jgi:hypothetical protein
VVDIENFKVDARREIEEQNRIRLDLACAETGRTETSGSNQTIVGIPAMETGGILVRGRISLLQSDTLYNATYLAKATA